MSHRHRYLAILAVALCFLVFIAGCSHFHKSDQALLKNAEHNSFVATLKKHLDAVSQKDLLALQSTLPLNGQMQLILPQTEIINSVDGFMA